MAKRVCSEGVQNVYSEILLSEQRIEKSILHKIKSEFTHRNRIDSDLIVDTHACKTMFDASHPSVPSQQHSHIKGFIQNISLVPFGFLLMSSIQVKHATFEFHLPFVPSIIYYYMFFVII